MCVFQAALRKISTACGLDGFAYEDIQSLIQPKMVEAYVRRSSLNESIVWQLYRGFHELLHVHTS